MTATTATTATARTAARSRVAAPAAPAPGPGVQTIAGKEVGRRLLLTSAVGAAGGAAALAGSVGMPAGLETATRTGAGVAAVGAAVQTVKVTTEVHKAALLAQLQAYLLDPHFSLNHHPVLEDWGKLQLSHVLLEALRLDGELSSEELEQFVDGLLGNRADVVVY
ncbi:MAG TPA: hypothetical protein VHS99_03235 [Chloroflexota bacterium]|nr:hypothetical protein [Chloroflexota bacterium]